MSKRNPTCGCGEEGLCNEAALECHPCCRCIPLRLCATLEAYGCDCDGRSAFMELDENDEYTGSISCGGEEMDIRVLLHHEDDRCYWRVISEEFYIDELFEIGSDGQSCEEPELEIDAPFYECPGTVTIERHEEATIPLVEDENGCLVPYCGDCRCACKTLCVTRREDGDVTEEELEWDGGGWGDIRLERDEYTGECIAVAEGFEPVPVDACGTAISLRFDDEYSLDFIQSICKRCRCGRGKITLTCCPRGGELELPRTLYGTIGPGTSSAPCPCDVEVFELTWQENLDPFLSDYTCSHCYVCKSTDEGAGIPIRSGWVSRGIFWCGQGPNIFILIPCEGLGTVPPGAIILTICAFNEVTGNPLYPEGVGATGQFVPDVCDGALFIYQTSAQCDPDPATHDAMLWITE